MSRIQAFGAGVELPPSASLEYRAARHPLAVEPAGPSEPSAFARALSGLGTELDRGEALLGSVTSGVSGHLGPAELIALQAGIYRYTEAVDLAAKLVDRATSAVRTTLQGSGG